MSALLQIKLVTVSDVALFNATCNSVNCKTILRSDCYVVDAKSFLGVMGLDLRGRLAVSYNGYDEAFEQFLNSRQMAV